jgi:hypothetical protein
MTVTMGAHGGSPARERALLEATRRGDGGAFGRLVEPYRAELTDESRVGGDSTYP